MQFRKDAETGWRDWFVIKKSNITNAGEGLFAAREFPAPKTKKETAFSNENKEPFTVAYYEGREFNEQPRKTEYVIKITRKNESVWIDGDGEENFNGTAWQ